MVGLRESPCGLLRADRLGLLLAEMLVSRRLLRGIAQYPANGILRAGADRLRRRNHRVEVRHVCASVRAGTARLMTKVVAATVVM